MALIAFAAHLPSIGGTFVFDDGRFIFENEAVHELTPAGALSFFTDATTAASAGADNIYRPLRTLDFAIDWAVSGGRPWFFHLRNILYFSLGAALVFLLLERLVPRNAAFWGAALFAVHPVHVESVAWISSRGDLLLLSLFLGAMIFHVKGRPGAACLMLVLALLAKETAVVFVGAAFVVDLFRGERIRWRRYAVYGAVSIAYGIFWLSITTRGGGQMVGQTTLWLGGSRAAAAVTAAKGLLYYLKLLVLPVQLVNDYYVPARVHIDAGAAIALVLLLAIGAVALWSSRASRFALLWGLVLLLPVLGILVPMVIPTAERFLLLPAIGFCLWAGGLLARSRLSIVVLACLFALTIQRTFDWRNEDVLWRSTLEVADTPLSLSWKSRRAFRRYLETGDQKAANEVVDAAKRFHDLFRRDIQMDSGGEVLMPASLSDPVHIRALIASGNAHMAVDAAKRYAEELGAPEGHYLASIAFEAMGRYIEAASAARAAYVAGFRRENMPARIGYLLGKARGE